MHSAKDMTSTDTAGLVVGAYLERDDPRDALVGADALRPGMRIGTASVRRRAQLLALEPTLRVEPLRGNIDTRLRKARERGLDALVLAAAGSTGSGSAPRSVCGFRPRRCSPRPAQGALALQVRAGEEELVAAADDRRDAPPRRGRARVRRARSAPGCLAPVAAHHDGERLDGADRGRGRLLGRAARAAATRLALAARAARRRRGERRGVKVIVTRPRAQAQPLVERLESLGLEVVECPLIEIVRTSDEPIDCAGYDWAVVTSPNGADEVARRARNLPKVAAVGPGTAETLRAHGIEPAFVASVSTAEGLVAEFGRPEGRVVYLAAEGSRRGPIDALGADFVPLYSTVLLRPEPPAGDLVVLASGSAARAYAGGRRERTGRLDRARDDAGRPGGRADASRARRTTHDLDGLVAAVAAFAAER